MWQGYFEAVKKGDWKRALESLQMILEKEGSNPQVYLKMGDVYQRMGRIQDAISVYHQSAWLFLSQGFKQKALALYKIILRLDPDNEEALRISREIIFSIESKKEKTEEETKAHEERVEFTTMEMVSHVSEIYQETFPPFLAGIPRAECMDFMKRGERRTFSKGTTVIEEGDSGDSIFFITSGSVKVVTHLMGKSLELAILGKGDIFGEVAFITGRPRAASIITLEDVEVIEFTRLLLEEIFERYPSQIKVLEDFYYSRVQNTISKAKKNR